MSDSVSHSFSVPVPLHLIQSIRLCHALAETRFTLCVPARDHKRFAHLQRYFDLTFDVGHAPPLGSVLVSHEEPMTKVGAIVRPLIFPHAVVARCQSKWQSRRAYRASFRGLLTRYRRRMLTSWRLHDGDVKIAHSHRGRRSRTKSWDDSYFDLLGNSEFALCPSGDHVWTYRFFEAALCGAIPIAQEAAPVYAGFEYVLLSDDVSGLTWSEEIAAANFERARTLLTVPRQELETAIASQLTDPLGGQR